MTIKEILREVYSPEMCFDLFINKGCKYLVYFTHKGYHYHAGVAENLSEAFALMVQTARADTTTYCFELEQDRVNLKPTMMYFWS